MGPMVESAELGARKLAVLRAAVAVPPGATEEALLKVELIDVGAALMVLVVGQHGRVDKQMIDRPDRFEAQQLTSVEPRLRSFAGLTIPEAQARALKLAGENPQPERRLLLAVAGVLGGMLTGGRTDHVLVGGVANLADEAARWRRGTVRRLFEA